MNNYTEMSDEKLIQFYLSGNPSALATLVELYKDRIYTSIYSMVQDKFVAEELFREVFISIINDLMMGKTADNGDFLQWAIQVAHRLSIEYTRKSKVAIVLDEKTVEESSAVAVGFGIPVIANNTPVYESHGKIKSLIAMLPDEQREVMALNHYAGLSFKEIAGIMKCSLTGALDTMKIGLHNLRKLMNEKEIAIQ